MRVKAKSAVLVFGLSGLVLFAGAKLLLPREPSSRGHRLVYWVEDFGGFHGGEHNPEASEALSAIGTNALPYLLDWIRCDVQRSRGSRTAALVVKHLPDGLKPRFLVDWIDESISHQRQFERALSAAAVFSVLGTNAEPFIPELQSILVNPTNGVGCLAAENALLHLGTNGFAAVMDVAASNPPMRGIILEDSFMPDHLKPVYTRVIGRPPNAQNYLLQPTENPDSKINSARAAPVLLLCLEDASPSVQSRAARYLSIGNPEGVVPALTNFLSKPQSATVRKRVTDIMATYGKQAGLAIPFLLLRLRNADPEIRGEATNALMLIAPEVLDK